MLQFNFFGREWIVEFENIREKKLWKTKHNKTNEATQMNTSHQPYKACSRINGFWPRGSTLATQPGGFPILGKKSIPSTLAGLSAVKQILPVNVN